MSRMLRIHASLLPHASPPFLPRPLARGGASFRFVTNDPREALALATEEAAGKDVRVGGGACVAPGRAVLRAGLVDRLHVGIAPVLLGRGENLWHELRGLEEGCTVASEVAESGTIHVTFAR